MGANLNRVLKVLSYQRNANQNYFEIHSLLRSITKLTAHAREDVEQEEHSSVAGKSKNLYNHYEKQYGSSSEHWELINLKIQLYHYLV